jgi:N-acetyl-beta-hexosaminidase
MCHLPQVFDAPRFIWRGVLLDVGRHFFSVPFIMKLLDLMALYKMNRFHWHLTEDQVGASLLLVAGVDQKRAGGTVVATS